VRSRSRKRPAVTRAHGADLGPLTDDEAQWLTDLLADADRLLGPEIPQTLCAYPPLGRMLEGLAEARRALGARERASLTAPQDRLDGSGICAWTREMLECGRAARADAERRSRGQ
jgi:hypothetical protein